MRIAQASFARSPAAIARRFWSEPSQTISGLATRTIACSAVGTSVLSSMITTQIPFGQGRCTAAARNERSCSGSCSPAPRQPRLNSSITNGSAIASR